MKKKDVWEKQIAQRVETEVKRYLPPEWDKIHLLTDCERREKVWGGIPESKKHEACRELILGRLFLLGSDGDNLFHLLYLREEMCRVPLQMGHVAKSGL